MDGKILQNPNKVLIILQSVILLFLLIILVKPQLTGYATKDNDLVTQYQTQVQDLKSQQSATNGSYMNCIKQNTNILEQLRNQTSTITKCETEKKGTEERSSLEKRNLEDKYQTQISTLEKEKTEAVEKLQNDLDAKTQDYKTLKDTTDEQKTKLDDTLKNYDALVQNTANNLCCKAKIDNPAIKSYNIQNNKVTCQESGDKTISC